VLFDEARSLDPQYAAAHAAAADALLQLRLRGRPPSEVLPLARAAAEQALQIDPESAEALAVLGSAKLWHAWDRRRRCSCCSGRCARTPASRRRTTTSPGCFSPSSAPTNAVAAIRRAQELDPLSPRATIDVGWVLLRARRYADAVAQANKTLELEPRMSEAIGCLAEGLLALGAGARGARLDPAHDARGGRSRDGAVRLDGPDTRAALRAAGEWRLARLLKRPGGPASWHTWRWSRCCSDGRPRRFRR
jgi:serine/threonine-protein kinase